MADENYWDDWGTPVYDSGLSIRQDLEARGVVFNEQGVPLSGLNQAMAEIDPTWTGTGTGSYLASVNPAYASQQAQYESEDFRIFKEYIERTRPEMLSENGGVGIIELWHMNQRGLREGTPLFADEMGLIATGGAGPFGNIVQDQKADSVGGMDVGGTRTDGFLGGESTDTSKGAFIQRLSQIGIPASLGNQLWSWAQEKLLDASYPLSNIAIDVYDQPAFKARFPAIEKMRDDDVSPVSPAEYIEYEKDVMGYLSQYGIQGQSFDFDTLITNLLVNHVGTGEVSLRLQEAKRILGNVPASVKQTYMDWFGAEAAEGNLILTFVDPTDEWGGNWADVQANVATAEIGGWAKERLNLGQDESISQSTAKSISQLGMSQSAIWERLDELNNRSALFAERIGEEDLEITQEGLQEKFGLTNSNLVERRQREREALFSGRSGVMMTGTGTGYGSANA